jgi:hypothetical protein
MFEYCRCSEVYVFLGYFSLYTYGLWAFGLKGRVRFPAGARDFSPLHSAFKTFYPIGIEGSFPGAKAVEASV